MDGKKSLVSVLATIIVCSVKKVNSVDMGCTINECASSSSKEGITWGNPYPASSELMQASLLEPLLTTKHGSCYVGRYLSFYSMVISKENLTSVVTKIRSLTLLLLVLSCYSCS